MATLIRQFCEEDYRQVQDLLHRYNFPLIPDAKTLRNISMVAIDGEKIVGFIWALVNGKCAYMDYFTVDEDYRKDSTSSGSSMLATILISSLLVFLKKIGAEWIYGLLPDNDVTKKMVHVYTQNGMTAKRAGWVVTGNVREIIERIERNTANGNIDNRNNVGV